MKKFLCILLAFAVIMQMQILTAGAAEGNFTVYVAENGDDSNDGSIEAPFKTLGAAADFVRKNPDAKSVSIIVRGGLYTVSDTVSFKNSDTDVLWSAYPGETPVISGAAEISGDDFEPADDLETEGIYRVDLKKYGVENLFAPKPVMQATFNGESLMLARWPNDSYYYPKVTESGKRLSGYDPDNNLPSSPNYVSPEKQKSEAGVIMYDDDRFEKWSNIEDVYFDGYWGVLWSTDILGFGEMDKSAKTIRFNRATPYPLADGICHIYAYNIFEELDAKGEYYINSDKIMYLYPPDDIKSAKIDICITDKEFFNLESTSNMTFSGLTFKSNAKSAFVISGGKNILIEDCSFTAIQKNVIEMNDTYDSAVASCGFYNIGGRGIYINSGDRNTLTPCGCVIENCTFEKFSQIFKTYNPAIEALGIGVRMSNNRFSDSPHSAIIFGGNEMTIEYNEFYDVLKETDDCGVIYCGRDVTARGHELNYNYFHDIGSGDGEYGRAGIYMDDGMCSISSVGNIFANMQKGYFMGGGRCHTIANNIFYNVQNPIPFDARNQNITHNQFLGTEESDSVILPTITKRYLAIPYDSDIWKEKYPDVYEMSVDEEPGCPKYNSVYNNALIESGPLLLNVLVEKYRKRIDNNVNIGKDTSGLTIKSGERPSLDESGDIFAEIKGFKPIPAARMGTYDDYMSKKLANAAVLKIGSPYAFSGGSKVFVDFENPAAAPLISEDRTLVPLRFISESFGADVDWDDASKTVSVYIGGKQIKLTLGEKSIISDGAEIPLDAAAQSIDGRTYIPLRALAEAIGKQVFWDERGLIYISDSESPFSENDNYILDDIIRKLS